MSRRSRGRGGWSAIQGRSLSLQPATFQAPPGWLRQRSGNWTFFGVAKPTLGARASRPASRPQLWLQAIGAAARRSEAGGTPPRPGLLRQNH
ncbi:MAG: hypothetical protein L0387_16040, partial [Acidobacteria bacterium]|nr:hypothetical protein [Acidobacteriota bacterium]